MYFFPLLIHNQEVEVIAVRLFFLSLAKSVILVQVEGIN